MKVDLKKTVYDVEGNPVSDKGTMTIFDGPMTVQVTQTGERFEGVTRLMNTARDLTYRRAIQSALRQAGNQNPQQQPAFDKDDCGELLFKLVADTDIDLSIDERTLARDACKIYSDTEVYMRVRNLLFPEDEGAAKKKSK